VLPGYHDVVSAERREAPALWVRELQGRNKRPVELQLSCETGVDFPVEVFDERGPGFVGTGTLGLSRDLENDLIRWQRWWENHVDEYGTEATGGTDAQWQSWSTTADRLAERLRQELGPAFQVREPGL
jgi:hypothetical protein